MKAENVELRGRRFDALVYEGDSVDLDELVREQILLALPARHLCREDCKGLCHDVRGQPERGDLRLRAERD